MELADILSKYLESPLTRSIDTVENARPTRDELRLTRSTAGGPQMLGDYGVYSPAGNIDPIVPRLIWSGRHSSNYSRCSRFPSRWIRRRVKRVHSHLYDGSCIIYDCNSSLYLLSRGQSFAFIFIFLIRSFFFHSLIHFCDTHSFDNILH